MATKVVGLDLGSHSVKCCELVTAFRSFELVGFGSETVEAPETGRPDFAALAMAAQRLLERRGLLGETLMCAAPSSAVSTITLQFPFNQPKKVGQVLPFQLDESLPFEIEDVVYDHQIIDSREDGCTVLVAYIRTATLAAFLEAMLAVGLDPKVVSLGGLSYFNLYDHAMGDAAVEGEGQSGAIAVLDLGHRNSELAVFYGHEPRLVRDITGGGYDITASLAELFKVPFEQAERGKLAEGTVNRPPPQTDTVVDAGPAPGARQQQIADACRTALSPVLREVHRSLVAHELQSGHPVELLYLTGGTSQLRGLAPWFERTLGIKVVALDPLQASFNKLASGGDELRPFIAKALALSLRAFSGAHQSLLNFRKGDHAFTGDFGFLRSRVISVAVAALVMIVLGAFVAKTKEWVLQAEYQSLVNQAAATSEAILGYETEDVDLVLATIAGGVDQKSFIPETSAYETLMELSKEIDFKLELDLDRVEIDIERKKLSLRGKTGSGGDVERLVDALRRTKCFKTRISKERVEKAVDDRTKFRLSATSICG